MAINLRNYKKKFTVTSGPQTVVMARTMQFNISCVVRIAYLLHFYIETVLLTVIGKF